MKRAEAQEILQAIKHYLTAGNPVWDVDEIAEACDMAIEAIKNEINCVKCEHYTERETPTGIKGVCKMDTAHREDIIRRSDALKPFCIAPDGTRIPEVDCDNFPVEFSVEFIKKHLLSLPSAEPKTGRWILTPMLPDIHRYKCSNCMSHHRARYEFCPSCGAKMVSCEKCKHWESDTGYCYEIADSDTHECHFERRGEEE